MTLWRALKPKPDTRNPIPVCLAAVLLCAAARAADEWPQFRGPTGQGHSDAKGVPLTWSEKENVKWKTPIPGEGWSSPVISGGQVWMTTAPPDGKSRHAIGVDLESGKILHDVEVFQVEAPQKKNAVNSHASPSPVIEGNRLYVHFGSDGTACLDTQTAKVLWQVRTFKLDHMEGAGGSPMLYKDKLIFCCDGTDVQYLVALKKETGELAWKTDRSHKITNPPPMRKAFSTPLVIQLDGQDQLIAPGAEYLYAYEPDTGKELWFVHYPGFSNVPRPVHGCGLLFVGTGFMRPEVWAVKPGGQGDMTATNVVWKMKTQGPLVPTPVLVGERLYVVSDTGSLACLEARTGKEIWRQNLGGEFSASPLCVDGRIYYFDRAGLCTVIEPGDTFKVLAKNTLESGCMASAAVAGKALIVRTKKALYRLEQ
ncbi:MAG: PQQ-binding-like beta-propeller repeat protein [Planctomycetota bacterium]|nr:PQQ-binding-like beta-propeller repeat protein [Planctomycetota bacterium]